MRKLYLIWYEPNLLNEIGELCFDGDTYSFKYTNYENNDLQLFSKNGLFYGFEDINTTYFSKTLFPTIKSRIPSPKREDYYEIIKNLNLKDGFIDFDMLEATEGKLSTDNFIFVSKEKLKDLKKSI